MLLSLEPTTSTLHLSRPPAAEKAVTRSATVACRVLAETPVPDPLAWESPPKIREWQVTRDKDGKIHFGISPNWKHEANVVYRLKKVGGEKPGRRYYGSVAATAHGNSLARRFSTHAFAVNGLVMKKSGQPKEDVKERGKPQHISYALAKALGKGERFTLGVVQQLPPEAPYKELLKAEGAWQEKAQTRERKFGYNHSDPTKEGDRVASKKKAKAGGTSAPLQKSKLQRPKVIKFLSPTTGKVTRIAREHLPAKEPTKKEAEGSTHSAKKQAKK